MKTIILDREGFLEEISISDRTIWGIESILDKHTIKPEEDREEKYTMPEIEEGGRLFDRFMEKWKEKEGI